MEKTNLSEIEFIESLHGSNRRLERSITKRDLQAAVKYGTKVLGFPHPHTKELRWKYEYDDITYITDHSSTIEVTSWAVELPLEKFEITQKLHQQYLESKRRLKLDPDRISSHAVFVVDQSRSMNLSDMNGHRSRSRGVYFTIATEFVAQQIEMNSCSYNDIVTVIDMKDYATIRIDSEPISWQLFNKLMDMASLNKPSSHGNYLPALQRAYDVFSLSSHVNCGRMLFFLSDGKPSDICTSTVRSYDEIYDAVRQLASRFGKTLTFGTLGFSNDLKTDFSVLEGMAARALVGGCAKSIFSKSGFKSESLRNALSSMVSSLTSLKTDIHFGNQIRGPDAFKGIYSMKQMRPGLVKEEQHNTSESDLILNPAEWDYYTVRGNALCRNTCKYREVTVPVRWGGVVKKYKQMWEEDMIFQHPSAAGIAIKQQYCGQGAERVVHRMTEVNHKFEPIGVQLVAKYSLYEEDNDKNNPVLFHQVFIRTQNKAANFATKFAARLDMLSNNRAKGLPRIQFLDCTIYSYSSGSVGPKKYSSVLCERRLDTRKYKKWNDNRGGVFGVSRNEDFIDEHDETVEKNVYTINEADEEDEDDDGEEVEENYVVPMEKSKEELMFDRIMEESDIPQTFSHWTYFFSKRNQLVCDLQGVLDKRVTPNVFLFTDPCIHSMKGDSFGRTDKRRQGINTFFKSHECNALCELLGLLRWVPAMNSCHRATRK